MGGHIYFTFMKRRNLCFEILFMSKKPCLSKIENMFELRPRHTGTVHFSLSVGNNRGQTDFNHTDTVSKN